MTGAAGGHTPPLSDAEVHDLLAAARATPLPASGGLSPTRAEELVREIRAGRDTR
jgi:hypothetical protein